MRIRTPGALVTVLAALALAGGLVVLPGCGFQLESAAELPPLMEVTYLEAGNPHSDLALTLERRLRASGVRLTDNREEATAVLRLLRDESGQRLLSISAENLPQEYEVYYTVSYQLLADGRSRLTANPVTVTRDYSYDETEVLGKLREEELIREALAADLVRLMMRRLATVE